MRIPSFSELGRMQVTIERTPKWTIAIWLVLAVVLIWIGIVYRATAGGWLFFVVGAVVLVGAIMLPRTRIVADKGLRLLTVVTGPWPGFHGRQQNIKVASDSTIVFRWDVRQSRQVSEIFEDSSLVVATRSGGNLSIFPYREAPHNAEELGNWLASYFGVSFIREGNGWEFYGARQNTK